jgi:chromosome segregation ATPase
MNPQYEAHERFCRSIGDMANENKRLQERIKQLEEATESANTFLQLVMCEQNHLRDLRNKANDRIKRLEEELNELRSDESRLLNLNGELERHIDQLEETGDELLYDNDDMTNINRWHEAKEAKP